MDLYGHYIWAGLNTAALLLLAFRAGALVQMVKTIKDNDIPHLRDDIKELRDDLTRHIDKHGS